MRAIRVLAVLIAAIVLLDFLILGRGVRAVTPALVGAIVISFVCWQDAAAPRQRRMLAICTCVLAAGLAVALSLATYDAVPPQRAVMTVLLACALPLAVWATMLSRRRRRPHGLTNYLDR